MALAAPRLLSSLQVRDYIRDFASDFLSKTIRFQVKSYPVDMILDSLTIKPLAFRLRIKNDGN